MATSAGSRMALVPQTSVNEPEWERKFHTWILQANRGRIGCTGRVTLTASQNATTVTDARAGAASFIGFMPTTAAAAVEWGNLVVQSQGDGFFIVGHTNNAIADRNFVFCIMG